MPLVKIKSLLSHATENRYGVAAINTFNYETVKWAIMAAEREGLPIIVQLYPGFADYIPLHFVSYMAVESAKKSDSRVAVHLDHSVSYEIAVKGIRDGFPSVMIDGSVLPYDENIALTAAVVRVARVFGTEVEAELGHVGSGSRLEDITNRDKYTDPKQAKDFVQKTGCDLLAIAVGNAHGPYTQVPDLDFDRIREIRKRLDIPLVMHGSSDIPDDQMREAVKLGMSKFNIATEYFRAVYNALEENAGAGKHKDAFSAFRDLQEPAIDFIRGKMRLLNPNGFKL